MPMASNRSYGWNLSANQCGQIGNCFAISIVYSSYAKCILNRIVLVTMPCNIFSLYAHYIEFRR